MGYHPDKTSRGAFLLTLIFILFCVSCTSPGKIRERNRNNLSRLTLDMSLQQVLAVMKRPYRSETLNLTGGERLELLYYHTDLKTPDGAVTDDELTPVVLLGGERSSVGDGSYCSASDRTMVLKAFHLKQRKAPMTFVKMLKN